MPFPTPRQHHLRLILRDRRQVAVDLASVQEIIHLGSGNQHATWDGPGSRSATIRTRQVPILDLCPGEHSGVTASPGQFVVVEIARRLHAVPALSSRTGHSGCPLLDLEDALRRSA